jgi:hypothetical protein
VRGGDNLIFPAKHLITSDKSAQFIGEGRESDKGGMKSEKLKIDKMHLGWNNICAAAAE